MIQQELIDLLACPQCKGKVEINATHSEIICRKCQLVFPVKGDIPVLLVEEASALENPPSSASSDG